MINVVIPYRNREKNLEKVLPILRAKLEQNKEEYWITIVEQFDDKPFNVGKLMNVGFKECYKMNIPIHDSFMFHPVDCYPDLSCNEQYKIYIRGVVALMANAYEYPKAFLFNPIDFYFFNGYSNDYWGWGGEDWEPERKCFAYDLPYVKIVYGFDRSEDVSGSDDTTNIPNMQKCFSRSIKEWNKNGLRQTTYKIVSKKSYGNNTTLIKVEI